MMSRTMLKILREVGNIIFSTDEADVGLLADDETVKQINTAIGM
jgi:hypothetical protein